MVITDPMPMPMGPDYPEYPDDPYDVTIMEDLAGLGIDPPGPRRVNFQPNEFPSLDDPFPTFDDPSLPKWASFIAAKDRGLRCKNFWSDQVFAPYEKSERVEGMENPLFLTRKQGQDRPTSSEEALLRCDAICMDHPGCEGFNFEVFSWGCFFHYGFVKEMR